MDEKNFKRAREITAILFLALALLLLLSLISYDPGDASFNRYMTEVRPPHNLIGVRCAFPAAGPGRFFAAPVFFPARRDLFSAGSFPEAPGRYN
jgi:hypothetical protein